MGAGVKMNSLKHWSRSQSRSEILETPEPERKIRKFPPLFPTWRCSRKMGGKVCGKEKGYLVDTFFGGTHITLKEVFSYLFVRQTHSQDEIQFDMRRDDGSTVSEESIVYWKKILRDVCEGYFAENNAIIGGPGKIVEVDETLLTKRKYHHGQLRAEEQWFFGGVERGNSENCFMVPVERRNAATLLPLIAIFIAPG